MQEAIFVFEKISWSIIFDLGMRSVFFKMIDTKCSAHNPTSVQNHLDININTIILAIYQVAYYFIPVHDSLQAVRDWYNCCIVPKLISKRQLNGIISFVVCSKN